MAKATIDTSGTTDTLAAGMGKVNDNFTELYDALFAVASVTYASPLAIDAATVPQDHVRTVTLTGNPTINAPTNGTNGKRFSLHLLASGAARTITLQAAIKTPTDTSFTGVIASGSTRVLELTYLASRWCVTRNLEFVA